MASSTDSPVKNMKIGVVGSGIIGRSWAMLFASAGYQVALYDIDLEVVTKAIQLIHEQLQDLEKKRLLRGSLTVEQQIERISGVDSLEECVKGAFYIQESVPENLELKKEVWQKVDPLVSENAIMASSASALLPSLISEGLQHRCRFVISHPTSPPFYAPLVEIIPAPWSDPDVVPRTKALLEETGQVPVVIKKEIDGFVLNRIQDAIFAESWHLVKDGVISTEDLDKVMTSGLGTRYAFIGPFETAHLNAEGFVSYCERFADMIHRIQSSFKPPEKMEGEMMMKIQQDLIHMTGPLESLNERRQWRNRRLAALSMLKQEMDEQDKTKQT